MSMTVIDSTRPSLMVIEESAVSAHTAVSASASGSLFTHPGKEVNVSKQGKGTPTPLDPADWDAHLEERIAIMVESRIADTLAKAKAHVDTLRMYGPRPAGTAPTSRETAQGGTGVAERTQNAAERKFERRTA